MNANFWERLKSFIEKVDVNDQPGEEEKEIIISICEAWIKTGGMNNAPKPETESDNFRINIIPELTRTELEERCIEMYERAQFNQNEQVIYANQQVVDFVNYLNENNTGYYIPNSMIGQFNLSKKGKL